MNICEEIKEAKCCSMNMGAKWVELATFGNETDEFFYNYLRLNSYIRTLERVQATDGKKNKTVNKGLLCSDKKKCLTDKEVCLIIEEIRLLCSLCGCSCN